MTDQELAKRIYGSFDALSPTKEVEQRSLDAIRQAQDKGKKAKGRVIRPWWIALPAAACIVALAIIVGVRNVQAPQASAPMVATDAQTLTKQESTTSDNGATGGYNLRDESAAMEEESDGAALSATEAASPAAEYSLVTLESGQTMRVGERLLEAPSYKSVVSAEAKDANGKRSVSCVVADGQYVLFPNEDVWYELKPVD